MARDPMILALANPEPEIRPEVALAVRPDCILSPPAARTIPNQVNNVLCFPFIFRGALDVRRHHDQRGDEARRRARASPSWRRPRVRDVVATPTAGRACASAATT